MSLAEAAVGGTKSHSISTEKQELLAAGDIEGLMALNRKQFGGFFMVKAEDDDSDDDTDDADEDADDDGDDDDEDDEDEGDKKSKELVTNLRSEAKKNRARAVERGKRIKALEAEIEALKGKQKPVKKAKDDDGDDDEGDSSAEVETLRKQVETSTRTNEDLLIRLEFMADDRYSWVNPKAALKLLDLDDVEITEDGEVDGLEEAIEDLAKEHPYLLSKDEDDEDEDKPKRKIGQKTGTKKKGQPNREALLKKYPALRR